MPPHTFENQTPFPMTETAFSRVAQLACDAGAAIIAVYQTGFTVETKADQSPLTTADLASHRIICQGLARLSQVPVLSEESVSVDDRKRLTWRKFWLVDPLDGTKEFIKRNGEFTVNIGLIDDGQPVAGFVYAPVQAKLYCALRGFGAFLLAVAPTEPVPPIADFATPPPAYRRLPLGASPPGVLRVVASRSHLNPETEHLIERLAEGCERIERVVAGSSLKLCLVAEGRADVYPRLAPTMEWDTAAAQAVVEAAGKSCLDSQSGKPLRYNKENLLNPHFVVS